MKKSLVIFNAVLFGFVFIFASIPMAAQAKSTFVTIGTGGVTGVYYVVGGAVGKIVNQKKDKYNLRVTVESTGGSVFNVNAVMAGDLEFGVVQSDRQFQAVKGEKEWKDLGPQKDLRAICSFHPESVVLIAGDDAGIEKFADLKGKHVNIGNPGSGQRGNSIDAFEACGINWETDLRAEGLKADESAKMLNDGRIDAFFYTVGHPNGSIKEATSGGSRKVHFVPIEGKCIDDMIAKYPYYAKAYIPVKHYSMARNKEDSPTFAVKATFCTSAKVSDDVVYAITKAIFDNLEELKGLHPAFEMLKKEEMLQALSAPIHPGALKYYKEAGLIK